MSRPHQDPRIHGDLNEHDGAGKPSPEYVDIDGDQEFFLAKPCNCGCGVDSVVVSHDGLGKRRMGYITLLHPPRVSLKNW